MEGSCAWDCARLAIALVILLERLPKGLRHPAFRTIDKTHHFVLHGIYSFEICEFLSLSVR